MVVAFVSKETAPHETRVASTPETVKSMVKLGLTVQVEAGAGEAAGFPDAAYSDAGAELVSGSAMATADLILAINAPQPDIAPNCKQGAALICGLHPMQNLPVVQALAEAGVMTFAMDLMPRITRAQKMDVLSSQATAGGYQAVLLAAANLPRFFPLLMTAAGTVPPARVLVLGAGVAGLQAIATARRLGAVVEANDIRSAVKEQVESLGASFVDTGEPPQSETTGGYAKETSNEYKKHQKQVLTDHISTADVVITTAMIPGRKAPVLVWDEMIKVMKPGSIIVDMAVESGGNVEGSVRGEDVILHGVKVIGRANLPGQVAHDASRMYARNINCFLELLIKDAQFQPDWEDEILTATLVTKAGEVSHAGAAEALSSKGAS